MQDRVPRYPGRVKLEPVAGQANVYDLTRQDQPTEEGTPINKATLLSDETAALLGLGADAVPNDALFTLALPPGKYAVKVTVLSPGGRPMSGVQVNGMTTLSGAVCITDSGGSVLGFTTASTVSLTALNTYLDITGNATKAVTLTAGRINTATLTFIRVSYISKTLDASATVRFSPDVASFDCSAIGGGQNGKTGSASKTDTAPTILKANGGAGGNAGQIKNQANVVNTGQTISVTVGAVGGTTTISGILSASGGGGAAGGSGGYASYNPGSSINAGNGGASSGFLYPATSVGGAGGGGGAYACWDSDSLQYSGDSGLGGSPGGGNGGYNDNRGAGRLPGAGGGGANASIEYSGPGYGTPGAGKAGLAGFVWRYQT